jgi:hypothetical protein
MQSFLSRMVTRRGWHQTPIKRFHIQQIMNRPQQKQCSCCLGIWIIFYLTIWWTTVLLEVEVPPQQPADYVWKTSAAVEFSWCHNCMWRNLLLPHKICFLVMSAYFNNHWSRNASVLKCVLTAMELSISIQPDFQCDCNTVLLQMYINIQMCH